MKTEQIHIRITPELKAQLQAAADKDGRTVSNFILNLIRAAVEQGED